MTVTDPRLADGRAIPAAELTWTFARASGPGGQSVNTTDSAVRLAWDVAHSAVITDDERTAIERRLTRRIIDGALIVTAREHRSQWANRTAALHRLVDLVDAAIAPPGPPRHPTRPSRRARAKRLQDKRRRSEVKSFRRPPAD